MLAEAINTTDGDFKIYLPKPQASYDKVFHKKTDCYEQTQRINKRTSL